MLTLYQSFTLAAAVADESAIGPRQSAKLSLAIAEIQYMASLNLVLNSADLTGPQRDEFHRELADLADILAALNCRIDQQDGALTIHGAELVN